MRRHATIVTRVAAIAPAGVGVKRFVLMDPEGWELPPARPGAHVDLHLPGGLVRTYSLCGEPAHKDRYVLAVKREAQGRGGSMLLHDQVQVGDEIGVSLPRGGVPLGDGAHVFVAGGIGVTPFLSAASALLAQGRRDFKLHLMSRGAPPLADQIAPLVAQGLADVHDTTLGRRPDLEQLFRTTQAGMRAACCGPSGMLDAFLAATAHWSPEAVHVEHFVPPPLVPDPDARAYTLVLGKSSREIAMPAGANMAEAIQAAGIDLKLSCGGGICGTCVVDYVDGTPLHRDRCLSPAERARKLIPCVAQSAGARLVVDL